MNKAQPISSAGQDSAENDLSGPADGMPLFILSPHHRDQLTRLAGHQWQCRVPLPDVARRLPILGDAASLTITVSDRGPAATAAG